jgi:3',5'-cyclic AMP phosphodiesterase CpdA
VNQTLRPVRAAPATALRLIAPCLIALVLSCDLDGWGWLWSSDVDDRYRDDKTLAAPADLPLVAPPYSFVVIADTHVFGNDTAARFAALQAQLLPGPNGDRFVLACGDLAQDGARTDFQTFGAEAAALGIPVYATPGNHDLFNNGWPHYRDTLGRSLYSFAVGSGLGTLRVIAVDSANGTLGGPQRAWLERRLDARTEDFCVTFTHMEFFSESIIETQQWTDINETYSLMHLLETSDVNVHFTGHTHRYLARTINGTSYVTAPALASGAVRVLVTPGGVHWARMDF